MFKSAFSVLCFSLVSSSIFVFGTSQAQAIPEASATPEQNLDAVHSTSALEEATAFASREVEVANRSETASLPTVESNTPAEKNETSNTRIPCASRIFPSLMQ
ncbi:hypothetical protein [Oscillatoria sp. FACHB-1406]|uniref:hypothetical protein n=1 Tax=Oscillatoria sp. FACHB-1406 TaxID=2692846 RepID=UPI00168289CF|nr:hypothetical protein [Oscillatoria sp. FACHB-1406]MBD2579934.1 hypothetical protein [Oscillatoria sp. FACHB-1406]